MELERRFLTAQRIELGRSPCELRIQLLVGFKSRVKLPLFLLGELGGFLERLLQTGGTHFSPSEFPGSLVKPRFQCRDLLRVRLLGALALPSSLFERGDPRFHVLRFLLLLKETLFELGHLSSEPCFQLNALALRRFEL